MKRSTMKITAGFLAAFLVFSGLDMGTRASSTVTSVLPSAGMGLGISKTANSLSSIAATSSKAKAVTIKPVEETMDVKALAAMILAKADEAKAAEEAAEFAKLVIAQVDSYVNVRSLPNENSEILGKLYDNSVGEFIEEQDGWYKITSGNVTGYVKAEYCVTGEAAVALAREVGTVIATVNTQTLYVRKEATTESTNLGSVAEGDQLQVVEELDGWVKVNIEQGDGYISSEYVTISTEFVQAESKEEETIRLAKEAADRKAAQEAANKKAAASVQSSNAQSGSTTGTTTVTSDGTTGADLAAYACQFVGNPYVWGGTSLTEGADCSGFVLSVYANYGVTLPHSSAADRSVGYAVASLDEAIPGDIICYSGHVAIYIGNGQIVHASTPESGIKISSANYRSILSIRRIF